MALEDGIKSVLVADSTLMSTLTGGIYVSGAIGRDGITRKNTPAAFQSGFLLPCSLIRERSWQPGPLMRDEIERMYSQIEGVEIYIYEDTGYTNIDAAKSRMIFLLNGYTFANRFPAQLINIVPRQRDGGALMGASLELLVFQIHGILDL